MRHVSASACIAPKRVNQGHTISGVCGGDKPLPVVYRACGLGIGSRLFWGDGRNISQPRKSPRFFWGKNPLALFYARFERLWPRESCQDWCGGMRGQEIDRFVTIEKKIIFLKCGFAALTPGIPSGIKRAIAVVVPSPARGPGLFSCRAQCVDVLPNIESGSAFQWLRKAIAGCGTAPR